MTNEEVLQEIEKAKASGATGLDLSSMGLTSLPPELFQLTNLTRLDLRGNQLTALPPEICQLTNLTKLYLSDNQLSSLSLELFQLTNLWRLNLSGNQLTSLPPEICRLTNLTEFYLSRNQFTTLPLEICQLTKLTALGLSSKQLTTLPPEICQLTNLKGLSLSYNQLRSLPSEIGQLTNLIELHLRDNQLSDLPPEICRLTKLIWLYVAGNPLLCPPIEIADKGIKVIREYFAELEKGQQALNEVKVLLIGDGAAGKTSLVKQLLGQPFDEHEDTTHGISIQGWEPECAGKQIRANVWDFGGQEIQHATHQFFLSKRSLYVLVLDSRKDESTEYWLRHVETFGGRSPVLVVLNKIDSNHSFDVNRPFLREKYPGICGFFPVSCRTGKGVPEFKEALLAELARMNMLSIIWPTSWFAVKRKLEEMDKPYISVEEYRGYCAEAGITGEESREILADFLHDLGVAVHFRDFILDAMSVLNPVWVTNAVYTIITSEQMADSKGFLALKDVGKLLPQRCGEKLCCPQDTHPFIMRLMEKFELCYPVGKEAVLIPQLLPVPEPELAFNKDGSLRFALHYPDFLPPSVFPRFMVKVHKDIHDETRWRTGVLLADKRSGSQAVVKVDTEARRINIWVQGETPREYLHYLRYLLTDINSSFEKLTVSERVPMPDDPQRTADYETLLNYAKEDIPYYIPEGTSKKYSVHELLGLVQPKDKEELARVAEKASPQDTTTWTEILNETVEPEWTVPFIGIKLNLKALFAKLLERQKQQRRQKK
ncbi:MAG: COR domain-containing protein [Candidatus Electrothrix scaldis]|nr:MAG: COR domain-containing protein [Candidatus Electrothrix sp. GW3-3]